MRSRDYPRGEERATFSVLRDLDDTQAIAAVFTRGGFRPHAHDTYLIGLTEAGAEVFDARGARHLSPAGSLRFFNPGETHTGAPLPGGMWGYRCCYPRASLMEEIGREAGLRRAPTFEAMVVRDDRLSTVLRAALRRDVPVSRLEGGVRLREVLLAIVETHAGGRAGPALAAVPRAVGRARAFIADHAAQDIALEEVAAAAATSRFHLIRLFRAATGMTPFAFQAQVRVGRARSLLAKGASVTDVARQCGFSDRSHLSRSFAGIVGVTPAAYRDAVSGRRP